VYLLLLKPNTNPFPKTVRNQVGFPLYYPSALPHDYALDKHSVSYKSGVVFYVLRNDKDSIFINEQKAPVVAPDLKKLEETLSFKKIDTPIGDAVTGLEIDKPTAILVTNTTLITVTGNKTVPADVIVAVVKSMASLPK
jgi:hypothetical protein